VESLLDNSRREGTIIIIGIVSEEISELE